MPGHHTENRVVVHGVNTCAVPKHTSTIPPETDTFDAQWEDVTPVHAPHGKNTATPTGATPDPQALQAVHDLFNVAGQNETVSLTITRTSTAPQRAADTAQTNIDTQKPALSTVTEHEPDYMKPILWTLVGLVAVLVIIKVLEFISTHALSILVTAGIIVCLAGAYRLIQPKQSGGHHE